MRKIYLLLFTLFCLSGIKSFSQTYFTESFEGAWYLNGNSNTPAVAAGPNAPSGWTQVRPVNNVAPSTACTTLSGKYDWSQQTLTGTTWSSSGSFPSGCSPYGGAPSSVPDGTKALWFYDGYTASGNTRLIYTPAIDLSAAANPLISFSYSYAGSGTSLLVGSLDGGTTWNTLSTIASTSSGTWVTKNVVVPAAYKIATAKFGFQIASTYGSYDVFIDNVIVKEGIASAAPTNITFTAISSSGMTVGWTDNSTNETAFRVYRSTDNVTFTQVNTDIASTTTAGTGTTYSQVQSGLLANKTYYFRVVSVYEIESTYLTSSQLTSTAANFVSTAVGGLWNDAATWAGGAVPGASDNITIADGAVVTLNAAITAGSITIGQGTSGVLQWNGTTNALTVQNDLIISNGAKLYAYTTGGTGQAINVGGNFTNNGYANLAQSSTVLSLNGSQQGTSLNQVLGGTGTFQGNGTSGIIRTLFLSTTGSTSINTTQNLITSNFGHGAGSVNTNGKLTIDNTAQVYGQALNTQVANVAVTTMGTAYSNAPVVFGASVTLWTAGGSATINTRYFSGNNVYIATAAGTFDGSTAPTHTSGSVTNGTVPLLWLGTLGTIGTPFVQTSVSVGTQYFYGNNLYVCTVAGVPSITAPPVHTSGAVASGAATFLYVGSPASVSPNYDATTKTVRSLTVVGTGSGYTSAPSISFSLNGGTVTTAASATAVLIQSIAGPSSSLGQKSGIATVTGTININSNQGASLYSGVGAITTTNGGVNYTVAPTVGFAGPTAINLVTNGGSGYTTAPTITVTGGTLITGTALTSSNFTITVAGGKIVSVYLNASTTATYSVPPTLAFSAGTATLAFPAGCWPSATAVIGTNGQITNFAVTNAGFGYVTAPTMGIGTTSATAEGGTFTTVATAPTCRIALYNISYGYFAPAATNVINSDLSLIPANGKANNITIATAAGASVSTNIELFSSAPLTLTTGLLDFGSNTVTCSNVGYAGASGSATSSVAGKIALSTPGGSLTRTFPYDLPVVVTTGTGSLATGSTVTSLTTTRTAAPSGTVNGGGAVTGTRGYRIQTNASAVYGTTPTVTLNYNATDALSVADNPSLVIGQSTALNGVWTIRSASSGTGPLSATGSRIASPVATVDDYYAWLAVLCGAPSAISVSAITTAGATISWTAPATAPNSYELYYSTTNTAPTSGTTPTVPAISGVTTSIATLASGTTYYIWVRSNCGGTSGTSGWISGGSFTTLCTAITTLPWTENFDGLSTIGSNILPNCWLSVAGGSSSTTHYTSANAASNSYNDPYSAPNYVTIYYPTTNPAYLWTPGFQLTAGTSYDFSFYYAGDATSGWVGDILYNSTQSATGATALGTSYLTSGTTTTATYSRVNRTFVPPADGIYYFGIKTAVTTTSPFYLGFDDFKLAVSPTCGEPTAVTASAITSTSAIVSWSAPTTGAVTNYSWELRTSGAAGSGATGLINSGNTASTSVNLPSLNVGTVYTFYVKTNCVNPDVSTYASTVFATPIANDDCATATVVTQQAYSATPTFVTGTTVGATASTNTSTCYISSQDDDVWYKFTATNSMAILKIANWVTASGSPGTFDYGVYSGACGSTTEVTCIFSSATNGEYAVTGLVPGTDYFVRILTDGTGGRVNFSFAVLQPDITPGTVNSCLAGAALTVDATNNNKWLPLYDAATKKIFGEVNAQGNNLGTITSKVYVNSGAIRLSGNGIYYLDRNYEITPTTQPSSAVKVRLYLLNSEITALQNQTGSNVTGLASLNVTKSTGTCGAAVTGGGSLIAPDSRILYGSNGAYLELTLSSFSTFFINGGTAALPVMVTAFKGDRVGADNVLSWTTSTEINNTGFELQRSADGVNFSSLTFVASKATNGNSNANLSYAFTDTKSLIAGSYYRLKQIDKDGKSTLSQVVFIKGVKASKLELVSVYPNPTVNTLNVSMVSPKADNITLIVSDVAGKVVVKQTTSVNNGDNNIQVNVSNLAKGTYTIKAICTDGCETAISKFVKQ